jgi:hypothetical protein
VSKDEAGLKREQIHSSNYLETLDLLRAGFIGANIGLMFGVIAAGLVMYFEPFGPDVPGFIYFIIIAITTLFGSWEGGLYGVATSMVSRRKTRSSAASTKTSKPAST